jgi:hypothetical protein
MSRWKVELEERVYNWSHFGGYLYVLADNEAGAIERAHEIVSRQPDNLLKAIRAVELTEPTAVDVYFDSE